jgi:hypothetical protein
MKRLPKPQPLKEGEAYLYSDGKLYRVGLLNQCRARLDPLWRKRREIVSRLHDTRAEVLSTPPSVSISTAAMLIPAKY